MSAGDKKQGNRGSGRRNPRMADPHYRAAAFAVRKRERELGLDLHDQAARWLRERSHARAT